MDEKEVQITTDCIDLTGKDLTCTTKSDIRKSDITRRIFENIIQDTPLEKNEANIAISNLLTKGVVLEKHVYHLVRLIGGLENPRDTFFRDKVEKYLKLFGDTRNEIVRSFVFDEKHQIKTNEIIQKFIHISNYSTLLDYESIGDFDEDGTTSVRGKNGLGGLIRKTGAGIENIKIEQIVDLKYKFIGTFDEDGIAKVQGEDLKIGLIQKTSGGVKTLLEPTYREITSFDKQGIAKVKGTGVSSGLIQKTKDGVKEILKPEYPKYREIGDFDENGIAKVQGFNGLRGLIQKTEAGIKEVWEPEYLCISNLNEHGIAIVAVSGGGDYPKYGLIQRTEKNGVQELVKPKYKHSTPRKKDGKYFVKTFWSNDRQIYPLKKN